MKIGKKILLITIILEIFIPFSNCSRKSEQVLYQEAQKALEEKKPEQAAKIYKQLIRTYPKSKDSYRAYFMLGMVYLGDLNNQKGAEDVWGKLVRKYPDFDLEKGIFDYAQLSQNQGKPELAIKLYREILSYFPTGPRKDKALFLMGFVCSEQLKDYTKAKEIFEEFLRDYPQSDLKDDAEFMLNNLGREPEFEK